MRSKIHLVLACSLLLASVALATDCDDACATLRRILAARATEFAELKGIKRFQPQEGNGKDLLISQWSGVLAPAEMTCNVIQDERKKPAIRYVCTTMDRMAGIRQQRAVQIYLGLAQAARNAAAGWEFSRIQLGTSGVPTGEKLVAHPPGENPPALQIIVSKVNASPAAKSWYVELQVYGNAK